MLRFKVAVLFKEFPMETSTKDPSQPTHQEISTFILKHKQTRWSMQNTKMSGSNRNTGGQAGVIHKHPGNCHKKFMNSALVLGTSRSSRGI